MSLLFRCVGLFAGLALAAGCGRAGKATMQAAAPIVVRDVGFATPESVLHDPLSDLYLVSNINGDPLAADDNGFISLLTPDGKVRTLKWIDGAADSVTLHAPKGLAAAGSYLFVADLNTLRRFDRETGAPKGEIVIPGATFLNDVEAATDGSVYFTDSGLRAGTKGFEATGTDAVYRLSPEGRLDTLARGEGLGHPNGIAIEGDTVWVVSFGSGELYRIVDGRKAESRRLAKGQLDGLVAFNGELFVSSWEGKAIYRGAPGGSFVELIGGLNAPADIGHDLWRHRLLVPLFNDNEVRIIPLAF